MAVMMHCDYCKATSTIPPDHWLKLDAEGDPFAGDANGENNLVQMACPLHFCSAVCVENYLKGMRERR